MSQAALNAWATIYVYTISIQTLYLYKPTHLSSKCSSWAPGKPQLFAHIEIGINQLNIHRISHFLCKVDFFLHLFYDSLILVVSKVNFAIKYRHRKETKGFYPTFWFSQVLFVMTNWKLGSSGSLCTTSWARIYSNLDPIYQWYPNVLRIKLV